ncbi:hypothetical protein, partial [Buttiauxella noackiae]
MTSINILLAAAKFQELSILESEAFHPERAANNEGALMAIVTDSATKDSKRLSDGPDWTFELLDVYLAEIDRV